MAENKNPYDISQYTSEDLLEILDLNNPSDRELEAKLISNINKYSLIQKKDADKIRQFYQDIYDYFFEADDEDDTAAIEGFQSAISQEPTQQTTQQTTTPIAIGPSLGTTEPPINTTDAGNEQTPTQTTEVNQKNTSFTTQLDYRKDVMNPLLKQTIKRVISIDSQYRDTAHYPLTTDFTFNLSETLKDVVSLKLYSIQIPYTWYTINNYYGSNFFYIKGNQVGNINDTYIIDISSGNYDPNGIVTTLQSSIDNIKSSNLDVSFGNTSITYNPYNSKVTLNVDIQKKYNEADYELQFPYITSPLSQQTLESYPITQSLAGYLGFGHSYYNSNIIYSLKDILPPYDLSTNILNDGAVKYILTNNTINTNFNNNYIIIQQLDQYANIINEIQIDIPITNQQGYTRNELTNIINSILSTSPYLTTDSSLKRYNIIWDNSENIIYQDWDGVIQYDSSVNFSVLNGTIQDLSETNSQYIDLSANSQFHASYNNNNQYIMNENIFMKSYFQMQIKLQRTCTLPDKNGNTIRSDISSSYIQVLFPPETNTQPIWTGVNSCFQFDTNYNNDYYKYDISGASIQIELNNYLKGLNGKPQYDLSYIIQIPNSPASGYTQNDYLTILQTGFQTIEDCSNTKINQQSSAVSISLNINKTYNTKTYDVSMETIFNAIFPTAIPTSNNTSINGDITINGNISYWGGKYTDVSGIVNDNIYGNVFLHDPTKVYATDNTGNLTYGKLNNKNTEDIWKIDSSYIIQTQPNQPSNIVYTLDRNQRHIIDSRALYRIDTSNNIQSTSYYYKDGNITKDEAGNNKINTNYIYLIDISNAILNKSKTIYTYESSNNTIYDNSSNITIQSSFFTFQIHLEIYIIRIPILIYII